MTSKPPTTAPVDPSTTTEEQRDINDIFDDILLTEEFLEQQGYDEGFADAAAAGNTEGFHLGFHRGAELGAELGYYLGVVEVYLKTTSLPDKQRSILGAVKSAILAFPETNDEEVDIFERSSQIRAQYRRCCALLKISGKYPDADTLSF